MAWVTAALGRVGAPDPGPQATTGELRARLGRWIRPGQAAAVRRWCDWADDALARPGEDVFVHGDLHGYTGRSAIGQRRRRVSIGEVLTAARREAGLTVTEVSQRTRIRETLIRGIERDFSACGGDFYARAHPRRRSSHGTPEASTPPACLGRPPPAGSASAAGRTAPLRCWSCSRRSPAWSPITS